jgi:hypothetical protein
MNFKKIAATTIMAVAVPILFDACVNPYADRGPVKSWCYGAGTLAAFMIIGWASKESMFHVEPKDSPPQLDM